MTLNALTNSDRSTDTKLIPFFSGVLKTYLVGVIFHQLGPLGRVGLVVAKSVCLCVCLSVCPNPLHFFWTGADCASPSRGALKTGRCSELDNPPSPPLSKSLVVGPSVHRSVVRLCEKVTFRVSYGN